MAFPKGQTNPLGPKHGIMEVDVVMNLNMQNISGLLPICYLCPKNCNSLMMEERQNQAFSCLVQKVYVKLCIVY
jgi:hypothetical protein